MSERSVCSIIATQVVQEGYRETWLIAVVCREERRGNLEGEIFGNENENRGVSLALSCAVAERKSMEVERVER